MTIEINGMAHVILTVSRLRLPASSIQPCDPALAGERFVQKQVGLHHLCLRARSREDVNKCAALLGEMGATMVHGPAEDAWAPGSYSVLFQDPDGIRLR